MKPSVKDMYKFKESFIDKEVEVEGWIKTKRSSKKLGFIELNDGTFFKNLQVIYEENINDFDQIEKLPIYTAIKVIGRVVETPNAKQPFEIRAQEISVLAPSDNDYPIQKKKHSLEYLRTLQHLRPRTNTFNAVFRVRSLMAYAIHKFFQEKGWAKKRWLVFR